MPRCEREGCKSRPIYNHPGETRGKYCFNHREEGMINVISGKCEKEGCKTQPVYNHPGETKGKYCFNHREEGMIDVVHKKCERLGCKSRPSYNHPSEMKGKYCFNHKEEGMIDVVHKKCERLGCKTMPVYNHPGETKGKYCFDHKEEGMINVVHKKCERLGCKTIPKYNHPGETKGKYCSSHRVEGMIDVISRKCEREGCDKTQPKYNYASETKGKYCFKHREEGMIDVVHKKCQVCKENLAYFGYPGQPLSFCSTCKKEGTIRNPKKQCTTEKCKEMALYGYRAQISCEKHKSNDMTNLVEKKCKKCGNVMVLSPSGECEFCCEDWVGIVRKKKEYEIKHFLDKNDFSYISHDRKIQHSTLLNRPDFLFLSNNQKYYVVLEVDEYQHTFNKEECECVRMVNISQELGKPVIFIRYNPDEYKVGNKKYNPSLIERQKNLKVWLRGALSKSEEDIRNFGYLSFVQLYYDGYVKGSGKYETILNFS